MIGYGLNCFRITLKADFCVSGAEISSSATLRFFSIAYSGGRIGDLPAKSGRSVTSYAVSLLRWHSVPQPYGYHSAVGQILSARFKYKVLHV
jgi:hypothetical protein